MQQIKNFAQRYWPIWVLVLLVLRPKRFMLDYVFAFKDYRLFKTSLKPLRDFLARRQEPVEGVGKLAIVAGSAMGAQWMQIWSVLAACARLEGYDVVVFTSKRSPIQNLYMRIFNFQLLYLEDMKFAEETIPSAIIAEFDRLKSFHDFKNYEAEGVPFGKMALSTFSRQRATGIMDIEDTESKREVRHWLEQLYKTYKVAQRIYTQHDIRMLYFTEVFMEEYGALYYASLKSNLNIMRFAGTVRDDAIVVHHLNEESDRTHFSSIRPSSWSRILSYADSPVMEAELDQNFADRYGDKWSLSKRNQPNTRIVPVAEARKSLGVPEGRKVAVVYSHILYDTLFFNGEDLFDNYADWLVRTVKAACANPNVQWFIKVHPSNLWRGELESYHGGKYGEVRIVEQYIGELPDHVRFTYPDTPFSPYTWMEIADFGITVRGTSGIELAALGKTVITAGSGRYEDIGFSLNSTTKQEYLQLLAHIPDVPAPSEDQTRRGRRFAYASFCMKPFTLDFFKPVPRSGKTSIFSSDDLVYLAKFPSNMTELPASIQRFLNWSKNKDEVDFLNPWPSE